MRTATIKQEQVDDDEVFLVRDTNSRQQVRKMRAKYMKEVVCVGMGGARGRGRGG